VNSSFPDRLLAWAARHGRHDLPWQRERSAYRVWVSEVMLQQTQVATVIPYFERFMQRFPDLPALAAAPLEDVLAHWAGLGYYARARNLHRAAGIVATAGLHDLPPERAALEALPGIGRSTAAAILALTFGERHAILDGNVKRVLARHRGIAGEPAQAAVLQRLWAVAEDCTPQADVAAYTQAVMDLGAMICTRSKPACIRCPVATDCVAHREGRVAELPTPKRRREQPWRERWALLLQTDDGHVWLERRPPAGIWGGLLALPEFASAEDLAGWCRARGLSGDTRELPPVEHVFTHFRLRLHPRHLCLSAAFAPTATPVAMEGMDGLWYKPSQSGAGPGPGLPAPIQRLLASFCSDSLV
jgi:A/G-specific adenine glycosylase